MTVPPKDDHFSILKIFKTMKSTNFLLALAVCLFAFASCQQAPQPPAAPDLAKIRTEIQAMENAFADAWNSRSAAAIMAYYADDAVSMINNAPTLSGKEAIMKRMEADLAEIPSKMTIAFETMDVFAAGDLVVETGKGTIKDSTGTVVMTNKYMSLFEKRNGKYLCIRDCYNNDKKE